MEYLNQPQSSSGNNYDDIYQQKRWEMVEDQIISRGVSNPNVIDAMLKVKRHLFAPDALMATYPDALVVQTHRPVETIMASMCSLAQHTTEGWSNSFVGAQIGHDSVETWSRGLERFNTARAKYKPGARGNGSRGIWERCGERGEQHRDGRQIASQHKRTRSLCNPRSGRTGSRGCSDKRTYGMAGARTELGASYRGALL